ncbi:MAG: D-ribose transporter ATP-binding protein [Chloroflexi bacterium]|nr:D-ribose transporter ATP-binding protein [Chloroflexota bacterium]
MALYFQEDTQMDNVLIQMEGIEKSFPGVKALSDGQLELRAGEVHALLGENGAGKSTLMKILSGIYSKDAGRILYKGKEVNIPNPRTAQDLGICIVHQELNLMPHLTIAQNIFIGREPRKGFGLVLDETAINKQTQELFEMMHLKLNPRTKVSELSIAKQQMVEIAKALSFNSQVLIMDEPTAALTDTEIMDLFRIIRQLREKGVGIVHISHRLEELRQIADRATIMRDSRYIATVRIEDVTINQIISMMVGRAFDETAPEVPENVEQDIVLEVKHLKQGRVLKDVNFNLRRGEILGFAGLVGAGRTETARAVFGADHYDSGEVCIKGKSVHIKSPNDAVRQGIGYLSEDRKRYGAVLGMDVETNIVLSTFKKFLGYLGWVNKGKTGVTAKHYIQALSIKTPNMSQKVKNLSGGNQQKVIIGKWMTANTDILIFDEPTRGIDVGAKSEIYKLLNTLAHEGKSIIMISSELPEILRMSHRVIVMCEGRITGNLPIKEATQEKIMQCATQREAIL